MRHTWPIINDGVSMSIHNRHWTVRADDDPDAVCLVVDLDGPREQYDPSVTNPNVVHQGQRKLLVAEVAALTYWYNTHHDGGRHPTVVYVGAAPGTHLYFLARLFPRARFQLFDPAPFDTRLMALPGFEINSRDFTSADAFQASTIKNSVLFCDIRRGRADFEAGVAEDMATQREWVAVMRPSLSLLKFRIPYNLPPESDLEYLEGRLQYGVWSKPMSGETRLLVTSEDLDKTRLYSVMRYEQVLFRHNHSVRGRAVRAVDPSFLPHVTAPNNQYCACFDCQAELTVFDIYAKLSSARKCTKLVSLSDVTSAFCRWWKRPSFAKIIYGKDIQHERPAPSNRVGQQRRTTERVLCGNGA